MHSNIFYAAHKINVKKILFPGSACSYPKFAKQPVLESEFLNGVIEPTNLAYAAAKINGIVMGQAFAKQYKMNIIVPVLTNAYGINDCFDLNNSHVIPALMQKLHSAKVNKEKKVELWGTGSPLREFINSIDAANALLFLMKNYNNSEIINVGTGIEITILELANKIKSVVGYTRELNFDTSKPDGSPRKCLDSTKLQKLGWKSVVDFDQGLKEMYKFHFKD
jgi:GDP-L-fucose synthase